MQNECLIPKSTFFLNHSVGPSCHTEGLKQLLLHEKQTGHRVEIPGVCL